MALQRLPSATRTWLRIVARDTVGAEYASHWVSVTGGDVLSLSLVDSEAGRDGSDVVAIEQSFRLSSDAGLVMQLPLMTRHARYDLRSAVPMTITRVAVR